MEGRTVIVIAHRLSTVRHADEILVLDHGQIVEKGNHDQLVAQGKTYARLLAAQFERPTQSDDDESIQADSNLQAIDMRPPSDVVVS